jgi:hypothetical protein
MVCLFRLARGMNFLIVYRRLRGCRKLGGRRVQGPGPIAARRAGLESGLCRTSRWDRRTPARPSDVSTFTRWATRSTKAVLGYGATRSPLPMGRGAEAQVRSMPSTGLVGCRYPSNSEITRNCVTSISPRSVSLSSGMTGRARKLRAMSGSGSEHPRSRAAAATAACWSRTISIG